MNFGFAPSPSMLHLVATIPLTRQPVLFLLKLAKR